MPLASPSPATAPRSAARKGWLPIWAHFTLSVLFAFADFIGGYLAAIALGLPVLVAPVLAIAGLLIPQFLLYKLVPARCGVCGGRCWGRLSPSPANPQARLRDTFKYHCENCCKVVDTTCGPGEG